MGQSSLQQEKRPPHVDVVLPREVLTVHSLDPIVASDTCVVDDDVYLKFSRLLMSKVVLGHFYDVLWSVLITHIGLHDNGLDPMMRLQLLGELLADFLRGVGSVIEDEVATLAGEIASNSSTNTCRSGELRALEARRDLNS